jgi:hypothetical protein
MKDIQHITESDREDYLKTALINGSIMVGAYILRQGIEAGYKVLNGNDVPKKPADKQTSWAKALLWGMAAGALLGAAKVIMRPGINAGVDKILPE